MRRLLPLLALFAMSFSLNAESVRPPTGVDINETYTVPLRTELPSSCILLPLNGVEVILARKELVRIVDAKPSSWNSESERLALIAGNRAASILESAAPANTHTDCVQLRQPLKDDSLYLIINLLEKGTAAVRNLRTGQLVSAVEVRYVGVRCGPTCGNGAILVYLPQHNGPFLSVAWWSS
ncbi:MAG: hypothetical protein IV109_14645 [Rhodoferax sp.]|nr:hypothetical protein [Rhodoferax sp.]